MTSESAIPYNGTACSMVPTITTDCANAANKPFDVCLVRMRAGSQRCELVERCAAFKNESFTCRDAKIGRVASLPLTLSLVRLARNKIKAFQFHSGLNRTEDWLQELDIDLNGNQITSTEGMSTPPFLRTLDLGENGMDTVVIHDGIASLRILYGCCCDQIRRNA
ncbi:hypothetical protein ATCC90586_006049 [Pythium insidiosum]|nr:hypothetical protein ATCC90586_006049 [Pythium insidiosum]